MTKVMLVKLNISLQDEQDKTSPQSIVPFFACFVV